MLAPGSHIRDDEVWVRLGGGGMSDVWIARHTVLATPVIINGISTRGPTFVMPRSRDVS